jgi:hypothetical protein
LIPAAGIGATARLTIAIVKTVLLVVVSRTGTCAPSPFGNRFVVHDARR